MAELAASVLALMGTLKTCIDLWEIVTMAKMLHEDLDSLIKHMHAEQVRFLLWCQITDLHDLAAEVESRTETRPSVVSSPVDSLLLQPQTPDVLRILVEGIMSNMCRNIRAVGAFLKTYNAGKPAEKSNVSRIRRAKQRLLGSSHIPLLEIQNIAQASMDKESLSGISRVGTMLGQMHDSVKWTLHGKRELTEYINQIRLCNDELQHILDLLDRDRASRFQRWLELAMAATPMAQLMTSDTVPTPLGPLDSSGKSGRHQRQLGNLCQISLRSTSLRALQDLEVNTDAVGDQVAPRPSAAFSGHGRASRAAEAESLEISPGDIVIPQPSGSGIQENAMAFYRSRRCIVEWRYYSPRISKEGKDLLDYKMDLLTRTLKSCSSIDKFGLLPCRGYTLLEDEFRYGIVFDYPSTPSTFRLLRDYLTTDLRNGVKRDLEDRVKLAFKISQSLFQFFQVGWLHKNVRSSNILMFEQAEDPHHLPVAYLAGFGYSRRNISREGTEYMPSILVSNIEEKEWQLYASKEVRTARIESASGLGSSQVSSMLSDAYSLGILLLEIALWCPVVKLCSRDTSVDAFQETLGKKFEQKLRYGVGQRYTEVVRRCLEGDFGDIRTSDGNLDERLFLESFEEYVINELDHLYLATTLHKRNGSV